MTCFGPKDRQFTQLIATKLCYFFHNVDSLLNKKRSSFLYSLLQCNNIWPCLCCFRWTRCICTLFSHHRFPKQSYMQSAHSSVDCMDFAWVPRFPAGDCMGVDGGLNIAPAWANECYIYVRIYMKKTRRNCNNARSNPCSNNFKVTLITLKWNQYNDECNTIREKCKWLFIK